MKHRWRFLRWAGLALLLIVAGIQFIPVARTNPPVKQEVMAPKAVHDILRRSCYDCHSNETKWPWYSYVAPVSWFVVRHIDHGRGDLNFSEWPVFNFEAQEHALMDIEEQIRKGEMPLKSYTLIHRDAKLSAEDREILLRWAQSRGGMD